MKKNLLLFNVMMLISFQSMAFDFISGGIYYNIISSTDPYTVEVTYPDTYDDTTLLYSGHIVIPSSVTYDSTTYQVIGIGEGAFAILFPGLRSVSIPEGVAYIGDYAFEETVIDSIRLPFSLTHIGRGAFSRCYNLRKVSIPEHVKFISKWAFKRCYGLKEIHYNAINCTIEAPETHSPFYLCDSVFTLTIGDSVTRIPNYAFRQLSRLTSLTIPEGVTSIGIRSFAECIRVRTLSLPSTVSEIFYGAFENIPVMEKIYIVAETPPSLGLYAFSRISPTIPVYVPCLSADLYRNSAWGTYFRNIRENQPYNIDLSANYANRGAVDFLQTTCQSDTAIIQAIPYYGYQFSQWQDGVTDNPRTIIIDRDTAFMAEFLPRQYQITVDVNDNTMGYVTGTGYYPYQEEVILHAMPYEGYVFDRWHDGYRYNPRRIVITQDTILTAYFSRASSITENEYEDILIYSQNNDIIVKNAASLSVEIYDVTGRCIIPMQYIDASQAHFSISRKGIYIVRIDRKLTKKVAVL